MHVTNLDQSTASQVVVAATTAESDREQLRSPISHTTNITSQTVEPRRSFSTFNHIKMNHQQPVIDLAIAMISIPTLIIFALMLESNMREDWTEEADTRWTVLGLGIGLLLVSILICGYVTHRMGVCLWTGPLEDDSNYQTNLQRFNAEMQQMMDSMPPSYEAVMGYDIPPPPYHCVVNIEITDEKPPYSMASNYI